MMPFEAEFDPEELSAWLNPPTPTVILESSQDPLLYVPRQETDLPMMRALTPLPEEPSFAISDLGSPTENDDTGLLDLPLMDGFTEESPDAALSFINVKDDTSSFFDFDWTSPIPTQSSAPELKVALDVKVGSVPEEMDSVGQAGKAGTSKKEKGVRVPRKEKKREGRSGRKLHHATAAKPKLGKGKVKAPGKSRKIKAPEKKATSTSATYEKMSPLDPKLLKIRRPMKKPLSRKVVPEEMKDDEYFAFRRKNTDSARRCREKKKAHEEQMVNALTDAYAKIAEREGIVRGLKRRIREKKDRLKALRG